VRIIKDSRWQKHDDGLTFSICFAFSSSIESGALVAKILSTCYNINVSNKKTFPVYSFGFKDIA